MFKKYRIAIFRFVVTLWMVALVLNIVNVININWWIIMSPVIFMSLRFAYLPIKVLIANRLGRKHE